MDRRATSKACRAFAKSQPALVRPRWSTGWARIAAADLLTDSKTGGFLDQADNHAAVAALAPPGARCLDAFTYHGGFALALARRKGQVLASDEDAQAVARAQANAARNHLPNLEVRQPTPSSFCAPGSDKQRFDVVVLDPPALAKRQAGDHAALRSYRTHSARLAPDQAGGLAVTCSCSGRVSRVQFDELVSAAAAQSGRSTQILERRGAGAITRSWPACRRLAISSVGSSCAVISIRNDFPDCVRNRVAG